MVNERLALGMNITLGCILCLILGRVECGVNWLFPMNLCGSGMMFGIRRSWFRFDLTDSIVFSRLWAHLRCGLASRLAAGLSLMIRFVHTIATPRVIRVIRVRLRSMNITVNLSPVCRLPRRLTIRPRMAMLRVAAGLLVTIRWGPWARVTVTSMCRCRLLESLRGQDVRAWVGLRLMSLSSLLVAWCLF